MANDFRSSKLWLPNTFKPRILNQSSTSSFEGPAAILFLWLFSETNFRWFHQILSHVFHLLDHVKIACEFGIASGCIMLTCCLPSSVWFRAPFSGFSESNLSTLFMLPALMKFAKFLLMYWSFLLFQILISSFFCIATNSLKSAFTFPSLQSSSLFDNCFLLMVFEDLF